MNKLQHAIRLANRTLLTLTAMAVVPSVMAESDQTNALEEVQVVGIRASLEQNITTKRMANAVVDAISAEDIGKFPDKNVAEALQRVPGVSVSRDFGEGERVSIRGTDSSQNITLLNGQTVATSEWKVLSALSRGFNYAMLPSDLISKAEVFKSPEADIDEGSLGGTIILHTRKPLALDSGTASLSIEEQYSELSGEWDPSASAFASWKNEAGTLGVLGALVYQDRSVERHGSEVLSNYVPTTAKDSGGSVFVPWGLGSALFQQQRERRGIDLSVQYRPLDQLDATLHYLASELGADNMNQNFLPLARNAVRDGGTDTQVDANGVVTSSQIDGALAPAHVAYDVIYRDGSSMDTDVIDLDVNYDLDVARLHAQLGRTTSEGHANDDFYEFFNQPNDPRSSWTYTNQGRPSASFADADWITDPDDEMMLNGYFESRIVMTDAEDYAQIDAEFDLQWGPVSQVKVGYKVRDREITQDRLRTTAANMPAEGFGTAGDFWSGAVINGLHGETGFGPSAYFDPDRTKLNNYFGALPDCTQGSTATCAKRDQVWYPSIFDINEKVSAAYVKADFADQNSGIRGNVGVRYVTTDTDSGAWSFSSDAGDYVYDVVKADYADTLPSLNIAWDVADDVVLRAAAAKVIARPSPSQLTSSVSLTPESGRGTGGNPYLKPYRANQFDLGVEWYFSEGAVLAATAFRKDIEDYIFTEIRAEQVISPDGVVDIPAMSRPQNGPGVALSGIETQVQYSFENGLGAVANYTFTKVDDAELADGTKATLPGNSEHMANVSAFFENNLLNARLAYNYRSEYFSAQTGVGKLYRDSQTSIDAQFSYYLSENLTLRVEALNLTNETVSDVFKLTDGPTLQGSEWENGRRFYVGANYKF